MADPLPHAPPEWAEAAEHICRHAAARVLVIGARDAGKSTFCRFLADAAPQLGRSAALLDTDVGQKTIGPPASVTLQDRHGMRLAFVGTTDPVLGWRRLVEGTHRLAHEADADLLVVNTSGLLGGPGRRLKAAKIDAVRPNLLIALGDDPAVRSVLDDHPHHPALRLPLSPEARRKTNGERPGGPAGGVSGVFRARFGSDPRRGNARAPGAGCCAFSGSSGRAGWPGRKRPGSRPPDRVWRWPQARSPVARCRG